MKVYNVYSQRIFFSKKTKLFTYYHWKILYLIPGKYAFDKHKLETDKRSRYTIVKLLVMLYALYTKLYKVTFSR